MNVEMETTDYDEMINLFVTITEMVGEAAWGIDLPAAMEILYCEPNFSEDEFKKPILKRIAVRPESYRPIFEAIYHKMKNNKKYKPYIDLQKRLQKLEDAANVVLGHLTGGMDGDFRDCDPVELLRSTLD